MDNPTQDLRFGSRVVYRGAKKDNRYEIPRGCIGTITRVGEGALSGMYLVQWTGTRRDTTSWVQRYEVDPLG